MEIVLNSPTEYLVQESAKREELPESLSALFYARLVRDNPNHLLVRLNALIDLDKLGKECEAYHVHQEGGRGVTSTYTTKQLCSCLIVRSLYGWSYSTTANRLIGDLFLRYFSGFTIDEPTPSQSTIRDFADWMKKHKARLCFDEVLRVIDELFPEERTKKQYGDTFAMQSRAAKQGQTAMLRDSVGQLLEALTAAHPERADAVCNAEQKALIFGSNETQNESCLPLEKRKKIELYTAESTSLLLKRLEIVRIELSIRNTPLAEEVQKWRGVIAKILHDEFDFTCDDSGNVNAKLCKKSKGSYRYGCISDLEATFRNHGKQCDLGYNISIAATDRFVREIAAATGAKPDAEGIAPLLTKQLTHLGVVPPKLIYDSAAGRPFYFARVHHVTGGKTQLVARLVDNRKDKERFAPIDFTPGDDGSLTCPAGVVSTTSYPSSSSGGGHDFRFSWSQCQGCELLKRCRNADAQDGKRRNVYISLSHKVHRQALAYTQTDAFKEEYRERAHIERIIAGNTRYNGSRRARSYGTQNADFQAKMGAMAYNAKRLVAILIEREKSTSRNRYDPDD